MIRFVVPAEGHVTLRIHNVLGQEVMTVVDEPMQSGEFEKVISMAHLPSGTYFYTLSGSGFHQVRKMSLMK
jgi:hypothetical protein